MRENLKAQGIVLEEPKHPVNVLGQGHNPKETPEMFVEKVMRNQKRIERTIELYEQNQKKEADSKESQIAPVSVAIKETVDTAQISEKEAVA